MSDNFKRYLTFTKSERIAIISIVAIIVIILICKYLLIKNPPKRTTYLHNLDSIIETQQREIDSLMTLDSIKKTERRASYKKQNFEYSNRKTTNKKDWENSFKREPKRKDTTHYQSFTTKTIPIVDINTADTTLLKELPDIGSSFAKRIVEYRGKLGGFVESRQLLEVYGMDSTRYKNIENYITVDSLFNANKLRINHDSFKVLNRHPYLEYDDVKKIVNYREQKGLITSWGQLKKVVGKELKPDLEYYLDFE